jgi:type II secretory pathway component PulK
VLIVTIGIMIFLTGLALVFSREMRVEVLASGNLVDAAQAEAVVSGAAQHVINRLANNTDRTTLDTDIQSQAVAVGEGHFWLVRPDSDNERKYGFGVSDESAKLNINTASLDMLLCLPGMTSDLAASIIDWRDADEEATENGAESEFYLLQPEPYYCKNAPFETLEELLLVKGSYREILFGLDANRNGVLDENEGTTTTMLGGINGQAQCGVMKYLTVYSIEPNVSSTGGQRIFVGDTRTSTLTQLSNFLLRYFSGDRVASITLRLRGEAAPQNVLDFYVKSGMTLDEFKKVADSLTTDRLPILVGKVNVNTAPKEVLRCLPGLLDSDIDQLIATRSGNGPDLNSIVWVLSALTPQKAALIGGAITTRSYQYSADILGVSGNGRSFSRARYVFDMRSTPPRVLFRQDLTHLGWPLDAGTRESVRSTALASTEKR